MTERYAGGAVVEDCNHCGQLIMWLWTETGGRMPVDAQPSPRGNVMRGPGHARVLNRQQAEIWRNAGNGLYLHHVVSCPYARHWHKPRQPATPKPKPAAPPPQPNLFGDETA